MKIGDKVRFISDTGGGRIAGFQGKSIVLVEDEDGFQIPTSVSDVVVVDEDDYNIKPAETRHSGIPADDEDYDPADRPVAFKAKPMEYKGGDSLSVYLAFVPQNVKEVTKTTFETYLVNDSNYYIHYAYLSQDGEEWVLRSAGEIDPNTKILIEDFGIDAVGDVEHVAVQFAAYKRGKAFAVKPAADVRLRIDSVKFYKLHSFKENDFFDEDALIYPVIEKDVPARPVVIDARKIEKGMMAAARKDASFHRSDSAAGRSGDDAVVTDLHATELLETTSGMSAADILNHQLDVFRSTIDKYRNKKGTKLIFIHGKGEGVLRSAIIKELKYKYKKYSFQDASFQEYGYGATQVTIR